MHGNSRSMKRARQQTNRSVPVRGIAEPPSLGTYELLLEKIGRRIKPQSDGCWLWVGRTNEHGYGVAPTGAFVHRLVYETLVEHPGDDVLHHRCMVRSCVNPAHLEPMAPGDHARLHHDLDKRKHRGAP